MNRRSTARYEERWLPRIFWTQRVAYRPPCETPCLPYRSLLVVAAAQQVSKRFASDLLPESLLDSKPEPLVSEVLEVVSSQAVALTSPLSRSAVS